ncbi:hypothetical protein E1212_11220 [Jiangella ureilytica]|uniref:Tat pathway signal sequence domain protein n=1 Tax=Jiangella ureilytica TaxID=2530374 RepID=A0A4R4RPJ9_9ACTN|nr:hypothetical protein [Jiangella ureilytica]TDC51767.1 hypothetical protein E1212_11220 [Jiangella ureilytica]
MAPHMTRRTALTLGGALAGGLIANPEASAAPGPARFTVTPGGAGAGPHGSGEPTAEQARTWWTPQRQVWTPVGWKGHLFRFDVFYNGTTVCQPAVALPPSGAPTLKPYLAQYRGKDFQVTPVMPQGGGIPPLADEPYYQYKADYGVGIQGWREDTATPVLWTEWRRQEGLVLRQYSLAHVPGGQPIDEPGGPIYAWQRYAVEWVDENDRPGTFTFALRLSRVYLQHFVGPPEQQEAFVTMQVTPSAAPLTGSLRIDRIWNPDGRPLTVPVFDETGAVRMIVGTPAGATVALVEADGHPGVYDLRLSVPATEGTHVDVLVPMLAQPRAGAETEWALGWDGALAECEEFWTPQPSSASVISTGEKQVDEFFRRSVQLAEIIAEKSPDTGQFTFLTGSFGYDLLWSTPTSMLSHMFLDLLGRHEVVDRHTDLFRAVQGVRQPPGAAYRNLSNAGFFATPLSLQSFDWLGDHGAILEGAARHALYSHDEAFLERWLDPIVAACDFIKRACEYTEHDGVKGLMPAAASNDTGVEQQSIWIQVWNYKGLASSVRLLRRLGHPRAGEFAAVADRLRTAFADALRAAAEDAPTWTHPDGTEHPVLPTKFTGPDSPWPFLEAFDTGALTAVWAGLLPADDPLMRSYVDFFRVGPNTRLFDPHHHTALDRVVLDHEQSSGEPCYSWNLFHTWQLGDRDLFLEGLYGLISGAVSPDTFISGEHRNAMYGTLFVQPLITWAARHAVIDDSLVDDELHLLRLCPLAWIRDDHETRFERMPTLHGPVSLRFRLSEDGQSLTVAYEGSWTERGPRRTLLHPPALPGLKWVLVNRQRYAADDVIVLKPGR